MCNIVGIHLGLASVDFRRISNVQKVWAQSSNLRIYPLKVCYLLKLYLLIPMILIHRMGTLGYLTSVAMFESALYMLRLSHN